MKQHGRQAPMGRGVGRRQPLLKDASVCLDLTAQFEEIPTPGAASWWRSVG